MNEIILDTITFDYLIRNQKVLTPKALKSIQNVDVIYLCVTSIWELSNHVREGLIPLKSPFEDFYQMVIKSIGNYSFRYSMDCPKLPFQIRLSDY